MVAQGKKSQEVELLKNRECLSSPEPSGSFSRAWRNATLCLSLLFPESAGLGLLLEVIPWESPSAPPGTKLSLFEKKAKGHSCTIRDYKEHLGAFFPYFPEALAGRRTGDTGESLRKEDEG